MWFFRGFILCTFTFIGSIFFSVSGITPQVVLVLDNINFPRGPISRYVSLLPSLAPRFLEAGWCLTYVRHITHHLVTNARMTSWDHQSLSRLHREKAAVLMAVVYSFWCSHVSPWRMFGLLKITELSKPLWATPTATDRRELTGAKYVQVPEKS